MDNEMTRIDALRALLAAHQPVEDDQRAGHTYRWSEPAPSVRLRGTVQTKDRGLMTLAGWRTA